MSTLITISSISMCLMTHPPMYDVIIETAVNNCPTKRVEDIDMSIVNDLVEVEIEYFDQHNIPNELRGMVLAAACLESGFNPTARGDWTRDRRRARAVGILQLWPWWTSSRGYNVIRTNHIDSARAWFSHIIRQLPRVRRRCSYRSQVRLYVSAWVHAIRSPRPGGRCREKPRHYRLLRRWKRIMRRSDCDC